MANCAAAKPVISGIIAASIRSRNLVPSAPRRILPMRLFTGDGYGETLVKFMLTAKLLTRCALGGSLIGSIVPVKSLNRECQSGSLVWFEK